MVHVSFHDLALVGLEETLERALEVSQRVGEDDLDLRALLEGPGIADLCSARGALPLEEQGHASHHCLLHERVVRFHGAMSEEEDA